MYTINELEIFFHTLALPEEGGRSLCCDYKTLLSGSNAAAEIQAAENKLFGGADWNAIAPHTERLSLQSGLHRYTVDFLFLSAVSDRLRADYRTAGLPDELFWDTIADLKYKLLECRNTYGIWGTFVAGWYPWFYTMRRFKLGRLQYEAIPFSHDRPVTAGGYTVCPEETVYNMHIPSCGPLTRQARLDSYLRAFRFYQKQPVQKPMAFVCDSWLLFPGNREILPSTLNMVDFSHDFFIYESTETEEFTERWRVYGSDFTKPDALLPEDTTQRRCFKKWLLAGGKTGAGKGLFFFDGENFYK